MYNSTYGAGYRAGFAEPVFKPTGRGTKVIEPPACPFSPWRFVSYTLWHSGYHEGTMKRLTQAIRRRA